MKKNTVLKENWLLGWPWRVILTSNHWNNTMVVFTDPETLGKMVLHSILAILVFLIIARLYGTRQQVARCWSFTVLLKNQNRIPYTTSWPNLVTLLKSERYPPPSSLTCSIIHFVSSIHLLWLLICLTITFF